MASQNTVFFSDFLPVPVVNLSSDPPAEEKVNTHFTHWHTIKY